MKDLLDECGKDLSLLGYKCKTLGEFDVQVCTMSIKGRKEEKETGFEEGDYFVLNSPSLLYLAPECEEYVAGQIVRILRGILRKFDLSKKSRFLIVGLGNPQILADSLGSKVLEEIHLCFGKGKANVFKFAPNIFANTGINSHDVVGMLTIWLDIDAVVVIDSLATDCVDRICASIQINTAGVTPGSALNSGNKKIGRSTLGVPCLAIGVPLMFYGRELGKEELLLTPKDIHESVDSLSRIIGRAISKVLL